MGVDAIVVRHRSSGVPHQIAQWVSAQRGQRRRRLARAPHPGAARLLHDPRAPRRRSTGRRIAIVGDINHSRVARSDVWAFTTLGAEVTLVAPPTLLPPSLEGWPVRVSHDLDAVLPEVDVGVPAAHAARAHDRGAAAVAARVHRQLRPHPPPGRPARRQGHRHAPRADEPRRRDRRRRGRPAPVGRHRPGAQRRGRPHGGAVRPAARATRRRPTDLGERRCRSRRAEHGADERAIVHRRGGRACVDATGASVVDADVRASGRRAGRGRSIARSAPTCPGRRHAATPAAAWSPPGSSTCTPTCASRARKRPRRSRPAPAPRPSAGSRACWPCPTPRRPSTRRASPARCSSWVAAPRATCARRRPSRSAGPATQLTPMAELADLGRAVLHRRRQRRAGRPADAPGARVRQRPGRDAGPALRGRGAGRGRVTCTRARGRPGSASPDSPPRPRS